MAIIRRQKSYCLILSICLNVAISSFFIGYCLTYVSAIPDFNVIINIYNVHIGSLQDTQSFIQGVLPVGSIFGGLAGKIVLSKFSRKNGFLLGNVLIFISLLLIFIKTSFTLILGRFIQGLVLGIQTVLVPLYINEVVPPEYRNLGTLHVIAIGIGQGFTYFIYWLFRKFTNDQNLLWEIASQYVLPIIILQTVLLIFVFPLQTPKYLIIKKKYEQLQAFVEKFYRQQYVDQILQQLEQHGQIKVRQQQQKEEEQNQQIKKSLLTEQSQNKIIYNTSNSSIFFGVYLNLSKQLIGLNAIVVYGKQTLIKVFPAVSDILPIIVCIIPSFSATAGSYIMKKFKRKNMIQFGAVSISITLFMIFLSFMIQQSHQRASQIMITVGMLLFQFIYGISYGTIVFLYNPQIVEPKYLSWLCTSNLSGVAFCIIIFPLIEGILPDKNPGYQFLFFFLWTFISIFVNQKFMIQTKDKSRQKIFQEYNKIKICQ